MVRIITIAGNVDVDAKYEEVLNTIANDGYWIEIGGTLINKRHIIMITEVPDESKE